MPSARYFERNSVGCTDCIYWRGLLQLPSDFDRAMREASDSRTVTDTDSYAFFVNQSTPTRGVRRHSTTMDSIQLIKTGETCHVTVSNGDNYAEV